MTAASTTTPSPQSLCGEIEVLLAGAEAGRALTLARQLWGMAPDAATARFLKRHLDAFWPHRPLPTHRVAILRSFTVEPVIPLLEAAVGLAGCRVDCWVGDFNSYGQEILNPASGLYKHDPQSVILAIQSRDLSPDLWGRFDQLSPDAVVTEVERCAAEIIGLLQALRRSTSANIICHGLERPLDPPGGLLDQTRIVRQADALDEINRKLRAWCADKAGTYVLDYDGLIGRNGRERWFDERKFAAVRLPLSIHATAWLASEWSRWLAALALPSAKVVALDLDNTLWAGVLGEDGLDGIQCGSEPRGVHHRALQTVVLDMIRRGVLAVLVSKNNEGEALNAIDNHPDVLIRRERLAGWRINWEPKPANLVALAEELNLGLDSFVFVDDNPAECEAVRHSLPEVEVIELPSDPALFGEALRHCARLERLSVSSDDLDRSKYYADERERRMHAAAATSLEDFLHSLEVVLTVEPLSAANLARAAQLTQKTNQLNTTTRRYTEAELSRRLEDASWSGHVLHARDRFGDNGAVGLALLRTDGVDCAIDTFLLSCRVIGRGIETAFLERLSRAARRNQARRLTGEFLPTAKNAPAAKIYREAGFGLLSETAEGAQLWALDLTQSAVNSPPWVGWEDGPEA